MNTSRAQRFDAVGDTIYRLAADGRTWCWGRVVWRRGGVLAVDRWESAP